MKKSYKNTKDKCKIFVGLFLLLTSFNVLGSEASPKALINSVEGNVFVTKGSKTRQLKVGDHLYDFDELYTETGSQVTFSDYEDHQYHLSGSAHIRIMNKVVELKRGYLWMQSMAGKSSDYFIQTANAMAKFNDGEMVISFDQYSGKTQMMVIQGEFSLSNLIEPERNTTVSSGRFSFIANDYENGSPRSPTPIGKLTFEKVTGLFAGVKPLKRNSTIEFLASNPSKVSTKSKERGIASVGSDAPPSKGKGQIVYFKSDSAVTELKQKMLWKYYQKKVKKMVPKKVVKGPDFSKPSGVKVVVYGNVGKTYVEAAKKLRRPASTIGIEKMQAKRKRGRRPASISFYNPQVKVNKDMFESSLLDEYKKQMRHSNETSALINELKSYDQDYKSQY